MNTKYLVVTCGKVRRIVKSFNEARMSMCFNMFDSQSCIFEIGYSRVTKEPITAKLVLQGVSR